VDLLPLSLPLTSLFETENPLLFLEKRVLKLAGWTGLEDRASDDRLEMPIAVIA
jgi:hypothetical protein